MLPDVREVLAKRIKKALDDSTIGSISDLVSSVDMESKKLANVLNF